jgi:hypothetical protein
LESRFEHNGGEDHAQDHRQHRRRSLGGSAHRRPGRRGARRAVRIDDPKDTGHGSDILALQVRNGDQNLHVVSFHENLRKNPATGSSGRIYIDNDAEDKGPEYVFVAGFTRGTDFVLLETEGFRPTQWGDPVEQGDYKMKVRYKVDRVHVTLSRHAIGDATDVRVAMVASGTRSDGTTDGLVDWVGKRRSFTPWIAQG